ncbi:MAG: amino acid ABC transporter substrate-binding protein, partial [Gammaproteobacteria bacterium]
MKKTAVLVLLTAALALPAGAGTLEDARARGVVLCGVTQGLGGFSQVDDAGEWSGLDIDVCRAVAAAVFG